MFWAADSSSTFLIMRGGGGGGGGWDDAGTTEKAFAAEGQIDADVVTAHYLRHAWR